MDKKSVLKIIADFKSVLEKKGVKIDKLILYGSYATLTYREESDIDIVVISETFKNKNYWERIDIISDAISEVFQPIEAVALTPEEWNDKSSFIVDYAKDGQVV